MIFMRRYKFSRNLVISTVPLRAVLVVNFKDTIYILNFEIYSLSNLFHNNNEMPRHNTHNNNEILNHFIHTITVSQILNKSCEYKLENEHIKYNLMVEGCGKVFPAQDDKVPPLPLLFSPFQVIKAQFVNSRLSPLTFH